MYLTDPDTGTPAWSNVGGTSAASPLWAALLTLTDASSACRGVPVGFANPLLYRLPAQDFRDVTIGNNELPGAASGGFSARVGYDMASGLGTPAAGLLTGDLCAAALASHTTSTTSTTSTSTSSPAPRSTVTLASPGNLVGRVGRSATVRLSARDSRGAALRFSASSLPAGLSLNPSTGVISGRPKSAARMHVTLKASDATGASAMISFTWTVQGLPGVRSRALHRSRRGQLTIELSFAAGAYAPAIATLDLGVSGVSFSTSSRTLGRWVSLASGHAHLRFRISRLHGRLQIVLARPASSFAVVIAPGADARVSRIHSIRLSGALRDSAGAAASLS
jgi:hypothetical protein